MRKVASVKVGDMADVKLVSGQTREGRIRYVSKSAVPATRTYRVEVQLPNADGAIPIERFVAQVLAGGYAQGFDLELIGPRIEAEGRLAAARRACETVSVMLEGLGA